MNDKEEVTFSEEDSREFYEAAEAYREACRRVNEGMPALNASLRRSSGKIQAMPDNNGETGIRGWDMGRAEEMAVLLETSAVCMKDQAARLAAQAAALRRLNRVLSLLKKQVENHGKT